MNSTERFAERPLKDFFTGEYSLVEKDFQDFEGLAGTMNRLRSLGELAATGELAVFWSTSLICSILNQLVDRDDPCVNVDGAV